MRGIFQGLIDSGNNWAFIQINQKLMLLTNFIQQQVTKIFSGEKNE